ATTNYLGVLDSTFNNDTELFNRPQHMWETAIWMQVADLRLIKQENGEYKIVPQTAVQATDSVFREELTPSQIKVFESGLLTHEPSADAKKYVYTRNDPKSYQEWMNLALPTFYKSVRNVKQN